MKMRYILFVLQFIFSSSVLMAIENAAVQAVSDPLQIQIQSGQINLSWFSANSPNVPPEELKRATWIKLGTKIHIWEKAPENEIHNELRRRKKEMILMSDDDSAVLDSLSAGKSYMVALDTVFSGKIGNHSKINTVNLKMTSGRENFEIKVPKDFVRSKVAKNVSDSLTKVSLANLYEDPDLYVGKIIAVEGYFILPVSMREKNRRENRESLTIGRLITRSDCSLRNESHTLFMLGVYGIGGKHNYGEMLGYFERSDVTSSREYPATQKPAYLFLPITPIKMSFR
jgi:hypothetical protein